MRRRQAVKQESLELLLDTICNTFGGVLFIAILVVLLLQQTSRRPPGEAPSQEPPVSPEALRALSAELASVTAQTARLRATRASQEELTSAFAPQEVRAAITTRNELSAEEDALRTKVDELQAANASLAAEVEATRSANAQVQATLQDAVQQRESLQAALQRERKGREQTARLPVLRSAGLKREIGVVLRYGRIYVWHRYDAAYNRLGLNTDDFVVVDEAGESLVTSPRPLGGVPLDGTAGSQAALRQMLLRFNPRTCYFAAIVRPDTYGHCQHFRDAALQLGFEYRLMPCEAHTQVTDRGGKGGDVQ